MNRRSLLGFLSTSIIGWTLVPKIAVANSTALKVIGKIEELDAESPKKVLTGFYANIGQIKKHGLTRHTMKIFHSDAKQIEKFHVSPEWMDRDNYLAITEQFKKDGKIVSQKINSRRNTFVVTTQFDSPESMIQYYLHFSTKPGFFSWDKFSDQGFQISRTWS